MEIKNLFNKFKAKQDLPEQFFALELSDDTIKSAVWTVLDGHTKVVKIGSIKSWDGKNSNLLIEKIDQSISDASENLDPEPSGVVFGLPEPWLEKENISNDKKALLKKICTDLDLKPLGFVNTDTAVIQYMKIDEGTPPSAIFLRLSAAELNLSLVKLGKILGTELVGRSGDLGPDVEEGLSRFKKIDTLPSRMILYNGQLDFEEDKQQLISYDWEEKFPFIHFPKVEVLPNDASIKAIALAGGSEVAKSLGFDIKPPPVKEGGSKTLPAASADPDEVGTSSEPKAKESPQPLDEPTAKSLGFSSKDVAESIKADTNNLGANAPKSTESLPLQGANAPYPETAVPDPEPSDAPDFSSKSVKPKLTMPGFIPSFLGFFTNLPSKLKSILKIKKAPKVITLVIVGFVLLLIAVFAAYWYFPKAKVTILVEPKTVDENLELTIDSSATTLDLESIVLPGQSVEISVEGSKSAPTTGTSLIGDPAQGDITIYNKTDDSKAFSAGTVLIGPDNLSFTLDEDVEVASASAGDESITFGKATGKVSAKSIGPDGNLSGGTTLSFKQFSESNYSAKVSDELSGGTAREVKAVSEDDQATLLEALTTDLKQKAASDLRSELGGDRSLVDVEDQDEIMEKSFNRDLNEEADNLKLDAKLEYTALSYRKNDLDLLLQQAIKEKIPDNYEVSASSEIEIEPAVLNKDNTATIEVTFKAKLIPKLDFTDVKTNLKGRYPHLVQEYLATLPGFISADITITPNLPASLKTMPRLTKNILIDIKTKQ